MSLAAPVDAAVAEVLRHYGRIDVLFNHAGSIVVKPFLDTTEEEWDRLMAVNVKSMYLVTRAVLPGMLARGKGSIVCTSSISAVAGTPMEVLYDTTKGACHMFARAIAVEYRDRGIRCNAVCPGFTTTEGVMVNVTPEMVQKRLARTPMQRVGTPEDVARVAGFLASDASGFVTGEYIKVDGGATFAHL